MNQSRLEELPQQARRHGAQAPRPVFTGDRDEQPPCAA